MTKKNPGNPWRKFGAPGTKTKLAKAEARGRQVLGAAIKGGPATGRGLSDQWLFDDNKDMDYAVSLIQEKTSHFELNPDTKMVTISYRAVVRRTEKAVFLACCGKRGWLPKSQIEFLPGCLVKVPIRLAIKFFGKWHDYQRRLDELASHG